MSLVDDLRAVVADGSVTAPVPTEFRSDWFGRTGHADVLVRAGSVADVAAAVGRCAESGVAVIPIGGNTGLVGGTLSQHEGPTIALSLAGLSAVEIEPVTATATVQAGVTIADLHRAARDHGLTYGVDLASRDSATVGGTIATNAGGVHVCAYGTTRQQVLGLEAVLADGSVVTDLRGLPKDNTGYSLRDLFVGSEGTLAVVTAARVQLHPLPARRLVLAMPAASLGECVAVGRQVAGQFRLLACEAVDTPSWQAAAADLSLRDPLPTAAGAYVCLVEMDLAATSVEAALALLGDAVELPDEAAVAVDEPDRVALWRLREAQAEWWSLVAGHHTGTHSHKYDITLPMAGLDAGVDQLTAMLADTAAVARAGVFGHVYEGSLHVQLVAAPAPGLDEQVLRFVSAAGGSLSAEHGVGRDKAQWLGLRRSPAELAAMRAIKHALDPHGILNPGAVLDE